MKSENIAIEKSLDFAVRIVNLYRYLNDKRHETVLSKQILRSGTSIGANINEAVFGASRADFTFKLHIALKEAAETEYWLRLLVRTAYLTQDEYDSLMVDCLALKRLLVASVKTSKDNVPG